MLTAQEAIEIGDLDAAFYNSSRATLEEYEALGEGAPYELIGGKLIMSPSPSFFHQCIQYHLANILGSFAAQHELGIVVGAPLDVRIGDEDVFQPDLLFIRKERVPLLEKDKLRVIPDLVIEITSVSTAYQDFGRKSTMYCHYGIEEYWIIEPDDERIEIRRKHGDFYQIEAVLSKQGVLKSPLFPGLSIPVSEIFAF